MLKGLAILRCYLLPGPFIFCQLLLMFSSKECGCVESPCILQIPQKSWNWRFECPGAKLDKIFASILCKLYTHRLPEPHLCSASQEQASALAEQMTMGGTHLATVYIEPFGFYFESRSVQELILILMPIYENITCLEIDFLYNKFTRRGGSAQAGPAGARPRLASQVLRTAATWPGVTNGRVAQPVGQNTTGCTEEETCSFAGNGKTCLSHFRTTRLQMPFESCQAENSMPD